MVRVVCEPSWEFPWGLSHSISLRGMGQKILFLWKQLFSETFVSTNLRCPKKMILSFPQYMSNYIVDPKKCSYKFQSNCQNTLWILIKCFVSFSRSITREKRVKQFFSLERLPFFLKNLCFQQPLRFLKKCSYKLYSKGRKSLWTFTICPLKFVTLDNTKKKTPNIFSHRNVAFFSKACVFNNLWGPDELILYFHNNCHNTLWTLTDCSLSFIMLDKTGNWVK